MTPRKLRTKIRRRKTRSGVRWYLSIVHPDGHEDAHGGFRTEREAKAAARKLLGEADTNRYVLPAKLTVGAYLTKEWLESRKNADISPGSRDAERIVVTAWLLPHLADIELQALTARDIDQWLTTLRTHGGRGGKPLRGKTARNAFAVMHKAMSDAVRRGHISANPVAAVDPPAKDDSVERTAWTPDEVRRFLVLAGEDRLGAVWRLAVTSGLRRGELTGLQWPDMDLETGAVTVSRQVLVRPQAPKGEPRLYVRETTKTRRRRTVRVDPETAAALRRWKVAQGAERLEFGAAYRTDGGLGVEAAWVVTEPTGHVVHPDTLLRRWRTLVKRAGVTPITLHGARHSYAELALKADARLDVVSRQLGHASIATTANVYLHDDQAAAQDAADCLGNILEGGR